MNKLILYIVMCILAVGGLVLATSFGARDFSEGSLLLTEDFFDFFDIAIDNGQVQHRFTVKNDSQDDVRINKIYTSCMCTNVELIDSQAKGHGTFGMPGHGSSGKTNLVVRPGQEVFLDVIFDPQAHGLAGLGLNRRSVYLETNSKSSPRLEIKFQATVTK